MNCPTKISINEKLVENLKINIHLTIFADHISIFGFNSDLTTWSIFRVIRGRSANNLNTFSEKIRIACYEYFPKVFFIRPLANEITKSLPS